MSFAGMRVLALESRRATEMAELIRRQQGDPFVAPSMREAPLPENDVTFAFAERLFRGDFDMMVLMTGVGTRALARLLATRYPPDRFAEALRTLTTVARGPKPAAALREMNVPIAVQAPEPNTWKEVLAATEGRPERRIAIQEYGRPNPDLRDGFRARGAEVTAVRIYQWALPEDTEPLRTAAERLAGGDFQVALFTTAKQIDFLMQVAKQAGLEDFVADALNRMVIGSIGPTTSEALEEFGIRADIEPRHPKMGYLVAETAAQAEELYSAKKSRS